jgi:hypothetical protein
MYQCSATCCKDVESSSKVVESCIRACQRSGIQAQSSIERELNDFQDQLHRCAQSCHDEFKQSNGSGDEMKMRSHMDKCVSACADKHVALLPKLESRLVADLKKISQ